MIKILELTNFKCFKKQTFPFSSLNVLAGINGMGKSTVIQSILLLRQNYLLGLLQNGKGLQLNGDLVHIGNAKDLLYQYFDTSEISIGIQTNNCGHASWSWDAKNEQDYLPSINRNDTNPMIFKHQIFQNDFHYLNAERIGPRVYFETSNYRVRNQNQIGIYGEYAANYLAENQNNKIPIESLKHPDVEGLTLYEQVNAWLGEIRYGTRVNISSNIDMGLVGVSYQFIGGADVSNRFRPTNVGFGLSFILPILVAVLASKPGTIL